MGEVYRARDTRLDRAVAIKILPEHLAAKPDAAERFEREARAISSLNHPNICQLYDVGSQGGTRYLVMELLEGETLVTVCGADLCRSNRSCVTEQRSRGGWLPHIISGWCIAT